MRLTLAAMARIWFLALCAIGIAGYVRAAIRFLPHRASISRKIGPVPTPIPPVAFAVAGVIVATRLGELRSGPAAVRVAGFVLSLYVVVMLPWTLRTLGRLFLPGAGILRDHTLVTSGPFRFVRHPVLSGVIAFWLGAALGTFNWLLLALWPLVTAGLTKSSRDEDGLLREEFGAEYEAYAARTGRFLPKAGA